MFAEIVYICKNCGHTFSVVDITEYQSETVFMNSQFKQVQEYPCPKCSSKSTEKLELNLTNRKKKDF